MGLLLRFYKLKLHIEMSSKMATSDHKRNITYCLLILVIFIELVNLGKAMELNW